MRLTQRAKVQLLAGTLLDLMERERGENTGRSPFGWREPKHSQHWREGSYHELVRVLDALRFAARKKHAWFWRVYVTQDYKLADVHPHKRHAAEQALSYAVDLMLKICNGNIYVPQEISENAGYPAHEAKAAARPRDRIAA